MNFVTYRLVFSLALVTASASRDDGARKGGMNPSVSNARCEH